MVKNIPFGRAESIGDPGRTFSAGDAYTKQHLVDRLFVSNESVFDP